MDGTQPTLTQVPPSVPLSISVTRAEIRRANRRGEAGGAAAHHGDVRQRAATRWARHLDRARRRWLSRLQVPQESEHELHVILETDDQHREHDGDPQNRLGGST